MRCQKKRCVSCGTFAAENMPEFLDLGLEKGRLCWYTDSMDNTFLIENVPGAQNLVVAIGGSGHGFKVLPALRNM